MKVLTKIALCLFAVSTAKAYPVFLQNTVSYGRFYDSDEAKGAVFQFREDIRAGSSCYISGGLIANTANTNGFREE